MANLVPIINYPFSVINNLNLSWVSNTSLSVAAGSCSDSSNAFVMNLSSATTLDATTNGLNGLDTGSLAASTWYYVFVIGDQAGFNPTGVLLSTSATAPVMPSGTFPSHYSLLRLIGAALTDSSSHFLNFFQIGNSSTREFYWDAPVSTSLTTATSYAAISLVSSVPPLAGSKAYIQAEYTPATAGTNTANFRPTGSSSTNGMIILNGNVVSVINYSSAFWIPIGIASGAAKIDFKTSSASDALTILKTAFSIAV